MLFSSLFKCQSISCPGIIIFYYIYFNLFCYKKLKPIMHSKAIMHQRFALLVVVEDFSGELIQFIQYFFKVLTTIWDNVLFNIKGYYFVHYNLRKRNYQDIMWEFYWLCLCRKWSIIVYVAGIPKNLPSGKVLSLGDFIAYFHVIFKAEILFTFKI